MSPSIPPGTPTKALTSILRGICCKGRCSISPSINRGCCSRVCRYSKCLLSGAALIGGVSMLTLRTVTGLSGRDHRRRVVCHGAAHDARCVAGAAGGPAVGDLSSGGVVQSFRVQLQLARAAGVDRFAGIGGIQRPSIETLAGGVGALDRPGHAFRSVDVCHARAVRADRADPQLARRAVECAAGVAAVWNLCGDHVVDGAAGLLVRSALCACRG